MFKQGLTTLVLSLLMLGQSWAQTDSISPELNDSLLVVSLRTNYYPSTPRNYDAARDSMYQYLDVDETDSLTGVYSGLRAKADGTRTPDNGALSFNTEHSWPQSFYNENEPMRGDIHHLFPTWSSPNQSRNNHPFGEVDDNQTTSWWYWENGAKLTSIPSENIDLYSEYANSVFEPREDHKGNAARAMFYFWTLYQTNSDIINDEFDNEAFFSGMKDVLYQWHQQDPVNADEVARSLEVESVQGNRNPFIHDTTLIRRAYFYVETDSETDSSSNSDIIISEVYEANGGTVKYVELFNSSDSTINLATGDWELQRISNANTTPSSTISLTGSLAGKSFYVVGDDNASSGVQTIFGEGLVDLSSSQINHNGNEKYLLVKNASTSPDTIDSFGKDNIGNSSNFAQNQVAYRIFSALPNDGSFGQTSVSSNGDTVASGNWVVFNISSSNSNATLVASPGYSKGIESSKKTEALITGSAQWRLLSIPANQATLQEISDDVAIQGIDDGSPSNVFTYNSSGSYDAPETSSTALANGEGLAVYFYDNSVYGNYELPIMLDVTGDESNSDVNVSLNTTSVESSSYFTLVGNPFQSNFDANALTSDNPIQSNIHVLNNGLYAAESKSTTIVLPWQGFWVESGTSSPATTVTFPTSGKTNSSATVTAFAKEAFATSNIQFNLLSDKSYDKGCLISFRNEHSKDWDLNDASKFSPLTNEYAILGCSGSERIKSVEAFPTEFEGVQAFDLIIESMNVAEQLQLEWEIDEQRFKNYSLTLRDNKLDQEIPVIGNGKYTFDHLSISKSKSVTKPTIITTSYLSSQNTESPRFTLFVSNSVSVSNESDEVPERFSVAQNYPNPFNPSTNINFKLPVSSEVLVQVFDSKGSLVKTLTNRVYTKGNHSVVFDGNELASGIYFYRVITSIGTISKPMLLLK